MARRSRSTPACCGSRRATSRGRWSPTAKIEVSPSPQTSEDRLDIFGNRTTRIRIETPHQELSIKALVARRSRARRAADRGADAGLGDDRRRSPPRRNRCETRLAGVRDLSEPHGQRLFDAGRPHMRRKSFAPGRPIYEAAVELSKRIHDDFVFDAEATEVTTSPEEAFAAQARRLPGFRAGDDRRAARPRPARPICQRLHPHHSAARQAAAAGRRRLARLGQRLVRPGLRLARPRSRPTRSPRATITSSSRAAATTPTCRRSRA